MRTILCNDCGQIITRYKTKCPACTRTNLLFYPQPDDPALIARLKEIRKEKGNHGLYRLLLASAVFAFIFVAGFSVEHTAELKKLLGDMSTPTETTANSAEATATTAMSSQEATTATTAMSTVPSTR